MEVTIDDLVPVLPPTPGVPGRQTTTVRNGRTNLYAAQDVAAGQVITDMNPRHRAEEFRRLLSLVDSSAPAHLRVHVVLDNSSTHKTPSINAGWRAIHVYAAFQADYSSWLNGLRRALVRRADHQVDQTQRSPLRPRPRLLDPHLDHQLER